MVQFKTFSERIEDVDIDVYRNLDPLKAEPAEGSSFFRDCIMEWRVRTFVLKISFTLYVISVEYLVNSLFWGNFIVTTFFFMLKYINFIFHLRSVKFLVSLRVKVEL